ncbi:MAG: hypothetical protein GXY74_02995, partial [Phycisphaerae bacterium]|nr:hypothetical protein [Phycisphaerae bacterium]
MRFLAVCLVAVLCLWAAGSPAGAVTVEYQVAASVDDTLTYSASSAYNVDNMFFPYDGAYPNNRPGFFRWAINVPAGATITSAYLKVNSYVTLTTASVVRLQLVDSDNCPALNSPNPYYYSVTSGYVDWTLPGEWTAGTWYTSPDIKDIVQEFIDRANYTTGNYLGLREDRYSGGYRRVRQWDYGDHTYGAKLEITYTTNEAPVADAGTDQEVNDSDNSGYELVTLDGTGSSDSDGTIASYVWSEGGSPIATGSTAQVSLAVGTHTITLTVTDDDSDTDEDTVQITVNQPPVANAGTDQEVNDSDNSGYELVTLDGTGSSDSDGTIASYVWSEGGSPIATGSTAQVSLSVGTHTITLTVTDDDSATDDDTVQITVNQPPVANAGTDQQVSDSDSSGYELVTLDGTGSSDSDGTIASYVWSEEGVGQIAIGSTAQVSLAVGTHTITLTVTDNDSATDADDVEITVSSSVTVEYQVAASADDTLTYSASSAYNVDNMFFPYDGVYPNNRPGFFRWAINVPAGATITSAYLKVNSYVTLTTASVVRLQLVDLDSCPALNSPNPYYYSVTSGYVDWTLPGEWTEGTWYTSPDIKTIVQEFIDRGNYTTGNYLGLREDRYSGGYRRVRQWDYGDHTYGAKLEITYTTGGAGNQAPVADAGSNQNVTDTDSSGYELVTLDGSGSSDSDGTIASYVWSEGGSPIATGETAQVSLAVGTHTITLTVTDDESATDDDTVEVVVSAPNQAPVANAGNDQGVT